MYRIVEYMELVICYEVDRFEKRFGESESSDSRSVNKIYIKAW